MSPKALLLVCLTLNDIRTEQMWTVMHFNRSPQKLQHLHCLMELFFSVYLVKGAVTFLCTQNQCKVPANGLFKDFKLNCLIFIKIPLVYSRLIFSFFFLLNIIIQSENVLSWRRSITFFTYFSMIIIFISAPRCKNQHHLPFPVFLRLPQKIHRVHYVMWIFR